MGAIQTKISEILGGKSNGTELPERTFFFGAVDLFSENARN